MDESAKDQSGGIVRAADPLRRQLFGLAVGLAGGTAAFYAGLPLPWLTGSLLAVAIAAISGLPVAGPLWAMPPAYVAMGASAGAGVTPEVLGQIHNWPLSLAILFVTFSLGSWISFRILRWRGWDSDTALLSSLPGALSIITAVAIERGADVQKVAVVQTFRVFILVLFLPILVLPDTPGRMPAPTSLADIALLVAVSALAGFAAARLRVPGGWIVGALIASAFLHGAAASRALMPPIATNAALVCLGTVIGSRFADVSRRALAATIGMGLATFAAAMLIAVGGAFLVATATGMDFILPLLAFAPGGLDVMVAVATVLNLDPAYVALHHVLRFLAISLSLPYLLSRLRKGSRGAP